jgi:hypothetical protein
LNAQVVVDNSHMQILGIAPYGQKVKGNLQ